MSYEEAPRFLENLCTPVLKALSINDLESCDRKHKESVSIQIVKRVVNKGVQP